VTFELTKGAERPLKPFWKRKIASGRAARARRSICFEAQCA
jgi:hypothetical protein